MFMDLPNQNMFREFREKVQGGCEEGARRGRGGGGGESWATPLEVQLPRKAI